MIGNDGFIMFLADTFFEIQKIYEKDKSKSDGYMILKLSVPLSELHNLYERLIKVDVEPIEKIPIEQKTRYWEIAKRYYTDELLAIKASKAAYMLSLITSNY